MLDQIFVKHRDTKGRKRAGSSASQKFGKPSPANEVESDNSYGKGRNNNEHTLSQDSYKGVGPQRAHMAAHTKSKEQLTTMSRPSQGSRSGSERGFQADSSDDEPPQSYKRKTGQAK